MWKRGLNSEEDNILQVTECEGGLPEAQLSEIWQRKLKQITKTAGTKCKKRTRRAGMNKVTMELAGVLDERSCAASELQRVSAAGFLFFLGIKSYRVRCSNRKGKEKEMIISKQGV